MASPSGFEPKLNVPKTFVLPLHHGDAGNGFAGLHTINPQMNFGQPLRFPAEKGRRHFTADAVGRTGPWPAGPHWPPARPHSAADCASPAATPADGSSSPDASHTQWPRRKSDTDRRRAEDPPVWHGCPRHSHRAESASGSSGAATSISGWRHSPISEAWSHEAPKNAPAHYNLNRGTGDDGAAACASGRQRTSAPLADSKCHWLESYWTWTSDCESKGRMERRSRMERRPLAILYIILSHKELFSHISTDFL